MPICLMTGATGFLGAHVARALVARGWTVRALARGGESRLADLGVAGVVAVPGDLSPTTDLAAAAAGVDAIVHVAGLTKARTLEEYREVNARGTARLVYAARTSAPRALFVLVSSQAAAGPARYGRPVREEDPPRPPSWYGISKHEGEEAVAREWTGPWIIVRPSVVYGPGDRGLLLLFRASARGFLPVPSGRSLVHVIRAERAAEAISHAAARPDLSGRRGFLCDPDPVSIAELCRQLARLPARPPLRIPIPPALVALAGLAETAVERITGKSRPFNADKARELLAGDWTCDGTPFARDLALSPPFPLSRGLSETWEWYLREGWLTL